MQPVPMQLSLPEKEWVLVAADVLVRVADVIALTESVDPEDDRQRTFTSLILRHGGHITIWRPLREVAPLLGIHLRSEA